MARSNELCVNTRGPVKKELFTYYGNGLLVLQKEYIGINVYLFDTWSQVSAVPSQ